MKRKYFKNRQNCYKWLAISFLVILAGLALAGLLIPDREYSATENRNLQRMPKLQTDRVLTGRFSSDAEEYIEDQFPFRTVWIQLKSLADRILGKTKSNQIYLGKEGYLLEDFTQPTEENYEALREGLRRFAQEHGGLNQYFLAAPTAVSIYDAYLPALAEPGDQKGFWTG